MAAGQPVSRKGGESALRDLVAQFFARDSAEYTLRAQLCTDTGQMPIEDAAVARGTVTVAWPPECRRGLRAARL